MNTRHRLNLMIRRALIGILTGALVVSACPLSASAEPEEGVPDEVILEDDPLDLDVSGEVSEYGFIDPGYRFAVPDEELLEEEAEEKTPDGLLQTPQHMPLNEEAAPSAFSLINIEDYVPELSDHGFVTPDSDLVTPVRSQGANGLCWVFAPMASIESGLLKSGQESSAADLDLSELQAAYYGQFRNETNSPAGCEGDVSTLTSASSFGSTGGNDMIFITSAARLVGVADESAAPYSQLRTGLSPELTEGTLATSANKYLLKNARILYGTDRDRIKELLVEYGALSCWVYYTPSGYNYETNALYYKSLESTTNHEGAVVGWDDNYPKENFRPDTGTPESDGAWLVKNSWGENSDRSGYYWISYEDSAFCTSNIFSFDMMPVSDGYDRAYQHDGGIENRFMSQSGRNVLFMANCFKAVNNSELKAISFYTREEGITYDIAVYRDIDYDPTSGELVEGLTSGSLEDAGYHTVELAAPVRLLKDETFSVVVKVTNPAEGSKVSLIRETFLTEGGSLYDSAVYSEKGESFYSFNGTKWTDMSATSASGNLRLKAFADENPFVAVEAVDPEGAPLDGAVFELTDGSGAVIATYSDSSFDISAEDPALIACLPESGASVELTLTETGVPRGYEIAGEGSYAVVIERTAEGKIIMTIAGESTLTVSHTALPDPLASKRLSGKNRYATAALIAAEAYPEGADEIILVTGEKFPDALAASAYAGAKDCPLLITKTKKLSDPIKTLLTSTWGGRVKKVTFIGAGFDPAVKKTLKSECGVTTVDDRTFAGNNRYDTADKVCQKGLDEGLFDPKGACVVVTGEAPADALAMSPWSFYYKMPVLLVKNGVFKTAASKKLAGRFASIYVGGAEAVVHSSALSGLKGTVTRLAGHNRYETAAAVADYFVPAADGTDGRPVHSKTFDRTIAFAPGPDDNYPDALVGGMLEGHIREADGLPGPILLVPLTGMKSVVTDYLTHYEASYEEPLTVYFLGAAPQSTETAVMKQLRAQAIDK